MIKTTLAALLVIGTASFAVASEADPNLQNRYPSFNMTKQVAAPVFTTRSVALGTPSVAVNWSYIDRASASYGGGY